MILEEEYLINKGNEMKKKNKRSLIDRTNIKLKNINKPVRIPLGIYTDKPSKRNGYIYTEEAIQKLIDCANKRIKDGSFRLTFRDSQGRFKLDSLTKDELNKELSTVRIENIIGYITKISIENNEVIIYAKQYHKLCSEKLKEKNLNFEKLIENALLTSDLDGVLIFVHILKTNKSPYEVIQILDIIAYEIRETK